LKRNGVGRKTLRLLTAAVLAAGASAWPTATARAGPPYITDDPEPVAFGHWEFYAASQWSWERDAASGTLPHFEMNYGAHPGVQLHLLVPAALGWTRGEPLQYGPGDVELGAKVRFVDERGRGPMIGMFPLVTLPTGSARRGLGAGKTEAFVPVWLQKSLDPWLTYGGAGIHFTAERTEGSLGWLLQRSVSRKVALGAEVFSTFPFDGGPAVTQINLGLVADLSERNHLLFSAGPSFGASSRGQAYLAYLMTL
jgi:hypothetical protein